MARQLPFWLMLVRPAPLAPIRKISRIYVVRTAFRPMHLYFGISVVDLTHHVGSAIIAVPCNRIRVFPKLDVLQCSHSASPQIVVMV